MILIVCGGCQGQKMGLFPFNPSLSHGKVMRPFTSRAAAASACPWRCMSRSSQPWWPCWPWPSWVIRLWHGARVFCSARRLEGRGGWEWLGRGGSKEVLNESRLQGGTRDTFLASSPIVFLQTSFRTPRQVYEPQTSSVAGV